MSTNAPLAERLDQIAQMMELLGMDRFRMLAHQRAARAVESLQEDIARVACDRKALLRIEGIGPKIADKIVEYCTTGAIREHEELAAQVPHGLHELLKIPGLGPKTVQTVWKEAGVSDLAGLRRIIDDGTILTLPRMGEKSVEKIKAAIAFYEKGQERARLGMALPAAEAFAARLLRVPGVRRVAYAGSLRRGRETIGDIDLLAVADDPAAAGAAFRAMPEVQEVLAAGETKSSVRARITTDPGRWRKAVESVDAEGSGVKLKASPPGPVVQVDLRVVPEESWGAALLYFTGSKEHNVALRERALKRKMTLNEYGLYPLDREKSPPQSRGVRPVATRSEEEVYAALGLPWIPPEIRENHRELELKETPRLVEVADIRSELHAHTTASDGSLSLAQLVEAARARGFHTIAVTDHSKSQFQAGGLAPERLREQIAEIREFRDRVRGITVLAGSEVDILADGSLDYDDDLLAELDHFVASPHASLWQKPEQATARLIRAIEHPLVRIIGHPTGRMINRREGLAPAMSEVYAAAREHNVALEINAHWMRLDLRDVHVRGAVEAGCLISINCDVHTMDDFDNLRYGVLTGRRGWLTPERCVNCWEAERLRAWLRRGRPA